MEDKNIVVDFLIGLKDVGTNPDQEITQENYDYIKFYGNTKHIKGFYIPREADGEPSIYNINIVYSDMNDMTVKRNPEIEIILSEKFGL